MTILPILRMGHPVLAQKAEPITKPTSPKWRQLANNMIATMRHAQGVGLAAPQVGMSVRLVVYQITDDQPPRILINPQWQPTSDDIATASEGCLSMPGLKGIVSRYQHIQCHALSLRNEPISFDVSHLEARVIQHECDHLDGILFYHHTKDPFFGFEDEVEQHIKDLMEQEVSP